MIPANIQGLTFARSPQMVRCLLLQLKYDMRSGQSEAGGVCWSLCHDAVKFCLRWYSLRRTSTS